MTTQMTPVSRAMKNQSSRLDADELLQLAIRSSQQDKHEESLNYLKQALESAPGNAKLHYFLGAEHAQIGLYDRAAAEMAEAVKLDPTLVTAHFQLGLLHITSGRVQEAEAAWKPLDAFGEKDPLFLFKTGLLHLARDEFDACVDYLTRGMKVNNLNEPLNRDMQKILDEVKGRQLTSTPVTGESPRKEQPPKPGSKSHVFLAAYKKDEKE